MKTCSTCRLELPLDRFYRNKSTADGHYAYCRDCWNAYLKERAKKKKEQREAQRRAKAILEVRASVAVPNPDPLHVQEPDRSEEVENIQEKMIERFGTHTGERRHFGHLTDNINKYGMEVCRGCGHIRTVDYPCDRCDEGKPVIAA